MGPRIRLCRRQGCQAEHGGQQSAQLLSSLAPHPNAPWLQRENSLQSLCTRCGATTLFPGSARVPTTLLARVLTGCWRGLAGLHSTLGRHKRKKILRPSNPSLFGSGIEGINTTSLARGCLHYSIRGQARCRAGNRSLPVVHRPEVVLLEAFKQCVQAHKSKIRELCRTPPQLMLCNKSSLSIFRLEGRSARHFTCASSESAIYERPAAFTPTIQL